MAAIHMTLQGKGGVGKSFIASLLAQHFLARGQAPICLDTDPVNQTFAGYKAFSPEIIRLGERPDEINPRYFDALIERIMAAPEDAVIIIDNGASTFMPLIGYMVEAQALAMLHDGGHQVRLHSVLTGGQALEDTTVGLAKLAAMIPDLPLVVWLNEYFGAVARQTAKGVQSFEDSRIYRDLAPRIVAMIRLPEVRKETFGKDIAAMMEARLTFEEAVAGETFPIMARQRLRMTWATLHQAMDAARL
ncbi:conjugal transfer protein TraL [Roseospira visakhapatnamensis]|uniref:Conjugal transfer protein TraL n=2 Tax=Roseospira visakhapatnamensis TaxID=390880 RepID=A0A7W6RFZ2_9PROT|nr:conjugal transfer protein TraL [Roseospira visakhapatnamensis]MBB4267630.1 hypothetical protein [Roseospira visakhapatnamensis]